jgi:hypothetical protein
MSFKDIFLITSMSHFNSWLIVFNYKTILRTILMLSFNHLSAIIRQSFHSIINFS